MHFGMKLPVFIVVIISLAGLSGCRMTHKTGSDPSGTSTGMMDGYRLVWSDEFTTDGRPDTTSWGYEHGFVRNLEDQWYQEENAWIK